MSKIRLAKLLKEQQQGAVDYQYFLELLDWFASLVTRKRHFQPLKSCLRRY